MIESITNLSLEKKIGQLFFIGIPGIEIDVVGRSLLDEISPGGVCLFSRNIREARQTRELLDGVRDLLPVLPFLSIDQEGGLVDRLRRIVTPMPAANKLRTAEDAAELAFIVAGALRNLGFNMDFAPVVDVIDEQRAKHANGLFSREFGRTSDDVVGLAGRFLEVLEENGIIGCLKHFPGLGASTVDSHEELPHVNISEEELDRQDLYPYRHLLNETRAVMIAHAAYPQHSLQERDRDGKLLPSSLSYTFTTTLLRERLGFSGIVITDDLEMGAIVRSYGMGAACKMAISAGADMLSICADADLIREGFNAVLSAVRSGEISQERVDQSLDRIAELKSHIPDRKDLDLGELQYLSERVGSLNQRLAT